MTLRSVMFLVCVSIILTWAGHAQSPVPSMPWLASSGDSPLQSDFSMKVESLDTKAFPFISMTVKFFSGQRMIRDASNISSEVREDGVLQNSQMTCSSKPFSVVLALDKSPSMAFYPNTRIVDPDSNRWKNAKGALHVFIDQLTPIDNCALVSFSLRPTVDQGLTTNKKLLHDALEGVKLSPSTGIWLALQQAINLLTPRNETRAIILITDGEDNASGTVTEKSIIKSARANNVRIFTVGLGEEVGRQLLTEVADSTGGSFYFSATGDDLTKVYYDISQKLAEGCVVTYTSASRCKDGTQRAVQLTGSETNNNFSVVTFDTAYTAPMQLEHATVMMPTALYAKAGEQIRVPVYLNPTWRSAEPIHFRGVVDYDKDLLVLHGAERYAGWNDTAVAVAFDPGTRTVGLNGYVGHDVDTTLFTLVFTSLASKTSRITRVSFTDLNYRQACPLITDAQEITVVLDGACEKILVGPNTLLKQNYPNPFTAATTIRFSVPGTATGPMIPVHIKVLNQAGECIAVPASGSYAPGDYDLRWDASSFPSGVYTIEMLADGRREVRQAVHIQ